MVAIKHMSMEQFVSPRKKRRRKHRHVLFIWLGAFLVFGMLLWNGSTNNKQSSSLSTKELLIKHVSASSLNAARQSYAKDIEHVLSCHDAITSTRSAWNLFCQAALGHTRQNTDEFACDAIHASRNFILDIWSHVRTKLTLEQLHSILQLAHEYPLHHHDNTTHVWSSSIIPIQQFVPPKPVLSQKQQQVFVDVGSQLGLTSLWFLQTKNPYVSTKKVISIEASPPNWLFQQLTFACQHYTETDIEIILAGPWSFHETKDAIGKVYWDTRDSTSSPSWIMNDNNLYAKEFIISTKPLMQLLPNNNPEEEIILHWNCQGCEYNALQYYDTSRKNVQMIGTLTKPSLFNVKPPYKRIERAREIACQYPLIRQQTLDCCSVINNNRIMDCSSWIDTEEYLDSEDEKELQWIQASSLN